MQKLMNYFIFTKKGDKQNRWNNQTQQKLEPILWLELGK